MLDTSISRARFAPQDPNRTPEQQQANAHGGHTAVEPRLGTLDDFVHCDELLH